ncbi:hypothetical protein Tco_0609807, partial [Tanacetum coccineum]
GCGFVYPLSLHTPVVVIIVGAISVPSPLGGVGIAIRLFDTAEVASDSGAAPVRRTISTL